MNKSIKQIYACLELSDDDIKILVAEYFNTRFNILKVEKISTNAINDFRIIDKEQLKDDITKLINDCSSKIGAKIEQLILVLPSYNFKRFPLRSSVICDDGVLTKKDIARAITNSLKTKVDFDVMVANSVINKYTVNGLSSRRLPDKEPCDEAIIDIDLLCCDKDMAYNYVSIIEECGIKVLDICLNSYAIGKEASLFEESLKQNIICLNINKSCTYLSLFSKGKLVSNEVIFDGLYNFVNEIRIKYDISDTDILKLIKYDVTNNDNNIDSVVYAYNESGATKSITRKDLNEIIERPLNNLTDKYISMCGPIIEDGASIFITGEGQQMSSLIQKIKEKTSADIKSYYPDTIGVRDSSLTSIYGALFAYKDKVDLNNLNVSCIDLLEYDSHIDQKDIDTEGETITTKIKNLFKQYVQGGD